MTAQEKAKELVDKFDETLTYLESKQKAKQCALICVDEIMQNECRGFDVEDCDPLTQENVEFWQEVKQEIEKL